MGTEGASKADLFIILITTEVCFISGSPDDVAVKKIRIYHRIVQAFKTRFGREKTTDLYIIPIDVEIFYSPHAKNGLSNSDFHQEQRTKCQIYLNN